jgi:hypothetical protein
MQRMKTHTAPAGIVHRIRQQVVQINQHRRQHDQPGFQKLFAPGNTCNGGRQREVQQHMYEWLDHLLFTEPKKKAAQNLGGISSKRCIGRG